MSQYRFVNYNYTNGLPITGVSVITEDSLGYLWLGSNQGLARFDGKDFQLFETAINDPHSL